MRTQEIILVSYFSVWTTPFFWHWETWLSLSLIYLLTWSVFLYAASFPSLPLPPLLYIISLTSPLGSACPHGYPQPPWADTQCHQCPDRVTRGHHSTWTPSYPGWALKFHTWPWSGRETLLTLLRYLCSQTWSSVALTNGKISSFMRLKNYVFANCSRELILSQTQNYEV